jgi:hypothetical protein
MTYSWVYKQAAHMTSRTEYEVSGSDGSESRTVLERTVHSLVRVVSL